MYAAQVRRGAHDKAAGFGKTLYRRFAPIVAAARRPRRLGIDRADPAVGVEKRREDCRREVGRPHKDEIQHCILRLRAACALR